MAVDTATKQASLINFGTPYYVILPWVDASAVEEQQHFLHLASEPAAAGAAPGPDPATNPNPADTATGVSRTPTLTWDAGAGAASHDVYFGITPTPGPAQFKGNQPGTSYVPGSLMYSKTYYWRIDEVNGSTTTGDVWSFTTEAPPSGSPSIGFNPPHRFAVSGDRMTTFPWRK